MIVAVGEEFTWGVAQDQHYQFPQPEFRGINDDGLPWAYLPSRELSLSKFVPEGGVNYGDRGTGAGFIPCIWLDTIIVFGEGDVHPNLILSAVHDAQNNLIEYDDDDWRPDYTEFNAALNTHLEEIVSRLNAMPLEPPIDDNDMYESQKLIERALI